MNKFVFHLFARKSCTLQTGMYNMLSYTVVYWRQQRPWFESSPGPFAACRPLTPLFPVTLWTVVSNKTHTTVKRGRGILSQGNDPSLFRQLNLNLKNLICFFAQPERWIQRDSDDLQPTCEWSSFITPICDCSTSHYEALLCRCNSFHSSGKTLPPDFLSADICSHSATRSLGRSGMSSDETSLRPDSQTLLQFIPKKC